MQGRQLVHEAQPEPRADAVRRPEGRLVAGPPQIVLRGRMPLRPCMLDDEFEAVRLGFGGRRGGTRANDHLNRPVLPCGLEGAGKQVREHRLHLCLVKPGDGIVERRLEVEVHVATLGRALEGPNALDHDRRQVAVGGREGHAAGLQFRQVQQLVHEPQEARPVPLREAELRPHLVAEGPVAALQEGVDGTEGEGQRAPKRVADLFEELGLGRTHLFERLDPVGGRVERLPSRVPVVTRRVDAGRRPSAHPAQATPVQEHHRPDSAPGEQHTAPPNCGRPRQASGHQPPEPEEGGAHSHSPWTRPRSNGGAVGIGRGGSSHDGSRAWARVSGSPARRCVSERRQMDEAGRWVPT